MQATRQITIEHIVIASNQPYEKVLEALESRMGSEEGWRKTEQRIQDLRFILAGHRILEVFWVTYWLQRLDETAQRQLVQEIVTLMREGVLVTSATCAFSLDEIGATVTQAETTGRQGKILLVSQNGS